MTSFYPCTTLINLWKKQHVRITKATIWKKKMKIYWISVNTFKRTKCISTSSIKNNIWGKQKLGECAVVGMKASSGPTSTHHWNTSRAPETELETHNALKTLTKIPYASTTNTHAHTHSYPIRDLYWHAFGYKCVPNIHTYSDKLCGYNGSVWFSRDSVH